MENGPALFYESWIDALKDDIKALGGTKAVGRLFWVDLEADIARNRLNDRLNPERRERLSDSQERLIIRLAREQRGFSAALCFLSDETGFERPKPKEPLDEFTELQRQFIESVRLQAKLAERIERLQPHLSRVA